MNKFCGGCGNQLEDGAAFCNKCGRPVNAQNGVNNTTDSITNESNSSTGYNATRTSATAGNTAADTTWTWIIVIVAAIAIIGLIWYYNAENNKEHNSRKDR